MFLCDDHNDSCVLQQCPVPAVMVCIAGGRGLRFSTNKQQNSCFYGTDSSAFLFRQVECEKKRAGAACRNHAVDATGMCVYNVAAWPVRINRLCRSTVIHASGRRKRRPSICWSKWKAKNAMMVPFNHLTVFNSMSWLDSIDDTPLRRTRSNPRDPTYNMSLEQLHEECRCSR
jgi:hypothetical protein